MRFEGKVALVTGSGRGIGRTIALRFAEEGADLVVNFFRNRDPAEETAEAIRALGRKAIVVKANIGEIEGIDQLFDTVEAEYGGLDIFVSNAASGYNRPVLQQKPKGWDWTMNINARALLFGGQRAAPLMESRGGGHIVAIGASKAALEALTRYLAVELSPLGIVVNAISPGIVETDALQHFDVLKDNTVIPQAIEATPAGRLVTPEDVAGLVAFLCSEEASMIRGQVILIDGGSTLPVHGVKFELPEE
jgi:enoyl-[acyl-carrier protein] reductase III